MDNFIINSIFITTNNDPNPTYYFEVGKDDKKIDFTLHIQVLYMMTNSMYELTYTITDAKTGKEIISTQEVFQTPMPTKVDENQISAELTTDISIDTKNIIIGNALQFHIILKGKEASFTALVLGKEDGDWYA